MINKLSKTTTFKKFLFILIGPVSEKGMIKKIKHRNILNMYGKLPLAEIFLLLKECKLFIGNDSGLSHIASCLKKPGIALFGPTTSGKKSELSRKPFCILESFDLKQLKVSKVFKIFKQSI